MMHILLAEDDPNFARMLMGEVRDAGTDLDWVANGVDAVLRAAAGGYDAVLLDLHMPRLDGRSALSVIHLLHPEMPVIVYSGAAGGDELAESMRLGAAACLSKPFSLRMLKDLLDGFRPVR